jgi:lipopolysaccharide export system permease protein
VCSSDLAGVNSVIAESVEDIVFRKLKTERSFRNKHFAINVKQVHGRKLIEPRMEIRGGTTFTVEAREAELDADLEAEKLNILLTDCTIEKDGNFFANPGTFQHEIPLSKATIKDRSEPRVSELGLGMISSEAVAQQASIRSMQQRLAARAAFQMVMGDIPQLGGSARQPDGQTWDALHQAQRKAKSRLNRLRLEPWRRCAEGFSCLFIVMVGVPLAIRMRTTNFFTTFAMCFFPVLCIYYPVLQWAVDSAKDGVVPPYTVWLGNGVLLLVGGWLTRNIVRY